MTITLKEPSGIRRELNMTREEWKISTQYIRVLLGELEAQGMTAGRNFKYKFALEFNPMFRYFHVWNGKSKNTIATVRITRKKVVVRYRPNSVYKYELQKMRFGNRKMVFIESSSLSRHRDWVHGRVQRGSEQEMVRVKAFLEQLHSMTRTTGMAGGYILNIPLPHHITYGTVVGQSTTQALVPEETRTIQVAFPTREECESYRAEVLDAVHILNEHYGTWFNSNVQISYRDILTALRDHEMPVERDTAMAFEQPRPIAEAMTDEYPILQSNTETMQEIMNYQSELRGEYLGQLNQRGLGIDMGMDPPEVNNGNYTEQAPPQQPEEPNIAETTTSDWMSTWTNL